MEYLNKVELRGVVGSARIVKYHDNRLMNFAVATKLACGGANGDAVVETTWHHVTRWMKPDEPELKKGDKVAVTGRLRNLKSVDADENERMTCEIVAHTIRIITDEE